MAIDGKVVGVRLVQGETKLTLESRDGKTSPGQETLVVENPPARPEDLEEFIGKELWGNSSCLMFGESRIAKRLGYLGIELVGNWQEILRAGPLKKRKK